MQAEPLLVEVRPQESVELSANRRGGSERGGGGSGGCSRRSSGDPGKRPPVAESQKWQRRCKGRRWDGEVRLGTCNLKGVVEWTGWSFFSCRLQWPGWVQDGCSGCFRGLPRLWFQCEAGVAAGIGRELGGVGCEDLLVRRRGGGRRGEGRWTGGGGEGTQVEVEVTLWYFGT